MYTHRSLHDARLRPIVIALEEGGGNDDISSGWSSFVGIVTAIIGNILISFALNTQRYAHVRLEEEHNGKCSTAKANNIQNYGATQANGNGDDNGQATVLSADGMEDSFLSQDTVRAADDQDPLEYGSRKSYLKSKIWWAGIIMMTVGEAGNFLAYGFAPASIVSPLGVVALVSNCLIAPLVLKERFRQRDFWGVVVAVLGAVTVVLSANHHEAKLDPDLLWNYYIKRWEFLVYVLVTGLSIIGLMIAGPKYGKRTMAIDISLVGLFGGYTAIATKGVAALLSSSLYKAFTFPIFYVLVLILVVSAIMQIRYLNNALQNFNSTQVIPTQFVCFTLSVIVGSAVLYREFESETPGRAVEFIAGCLLTFFGVYLITSKHAEAGREDKDAYPEDSEPAIRLLDEGEDATERTPLRGDIVPPKPPQPPQPPQPMATSPYPVTPPRSPSPTEIPSIAVTPAEPDIGGDGGADHSTPVGPPPRTPVASQSFSEIDYTPYFTPSTSKRVVHRMDSSPGELETPTRHQRTASLPKPDDAAVNAAENDRRGFLRSPRDSIRVLLPGPLLGPIASSPLSGIVVDSLRRTSENSSPISVRKRSGRSKTLRHDRRISLAAAQAVGDSGTTEEENGLLRSQTNHEEGSSKSSTIDSQVNPNSNDEGASSSTGRNPGRNPGVRQSRLRAMSETLGLLIRRGDDSSRSD